MVTKESHYEANLALMVLQVSKGNLEMYVNVLQPAGHGPRSARASTVGYSGCLFCEKLVGK